MHPIDQWLRNSGVTLVVIDPPHSDHLPRSNTTADPGVLTTRPTLTMNQRPALVDSNQINIGTLELINLKESWLALVLCICTHTCQ
jgi:hypothetical protein